MLNYFDHLFNHALIAF